MPSSSSSSSSISQSSYRSGFVRGAPLRSGRFVFPWVSKHADPRRRLYLPVFPSGNGVMSARAKRKMKLGMIVGNRGFFPDHLARAGHQEMRAALKPPSVDLIPLTDAESKFGAVETRQEAARCAALFAGHREEIDGVIVTLPNFGDERAIAETLPLAALHVPVLIQPTPDTPSPIPIPT